MAGGHDLWAIDTDGIFLACLKFNMRGPIGSDEARTLCPRSIIADVGAAIILNQSISSLLTIQALLALARIRPCSSPELLSLSTHEAKQFKTCQPLRDRRLGCFQSSVVHTESIWLIEFVSGSIKCSKKDRPQKAPESRLTAITVFTDAVHASRPGSRTTMYPDSTCLVSEASENVPSYGPLLVGSFLTVIGCWL